MIRGRKIRDPRIEALAFRIWVWCRDREWRTTAGEIAEVFDVSTNTVRRLAEGRGWTGRLGGVVDAGVVHRQPVRAGMVLENYARGDSIMEIVDQYRGRVK